MNSLNLIVMGMTGAGKSTLINAILGEDVAPTGSGQPVTKENKIYSRNMLLPLGKQEDPSESYSMTGMHLNLYDTVGLEIDTSITDKTISETKKLIQQAQSSEDTNDITLVWFCINYRSSRFEPYEIKLIKKLSVDHEIPFMIVITQCYTDERSDLETQIQNDFPEISVARVLAKEYKTRGGCIQAQGLTELLQRSVLNYDKSKVKILEEKLIFLCQDKTRIVQELQHRGKGCVESYSDKAMKIGFVPGGCIHAIRGMCIKMMVDLNKIVGVNSGKDFASEIFTNAVVGIIATPLMMVPLLSSVVASAYVSTVGEAYLDSLMCVVEKSALGDLRNNDLMSKRIKEEINKRKK